jgi:hypothetical protein
VGAVLLPARSFQRIPVRVQRTAWAACPKGTLAMSVRDPLDVLFGDEEFVDLFRVMAVRSSRRGVALASVLQFKEANRLGLTIRFEPHAVTA